MPRGRPPIDPEKRKTKSAYTKINVRNEILALIDEGTTVIPRALGLENIAQLDRQQVLEYVLTQMLYTLKNREKHLLEGVQAIEATGEKLQAQADKLTEASDRLVNTIANIARAN